VLANGSDTLPVAANASSFVFPTMVASGATYGVTVSQQPTGQSCETSTGNGTVGTSDVNTISVGCVPGVWGWFGGSNTAGAPGVYGTPGVASTANIPPSRFLAASWTDSAGNFWIFGGSAGSFSGVLFNDLWRYTPSTGTWTWVSGSNTTNTVGVYGTQGVPAASNVPGARANAVSWTDTSGNLWLFGGDVYQAGSYPSYETLEPSVSLNDLWEFNTTTGQWTWMGGSAGQTVDTTDVVPPPPQRDFGTSAWTDSAGDLWLYGNPLWEYTPSTGLWAQIGTPVTVSNDSGAVYGTEGVAAPGNFPGTRQGAVKWKDSQGNVWLFGGGFIACTDDMWEYTPSTGEWTWVSGSNYIQISLIYSPGSYGTPGIAAPTNSPGCRVNAMSWTDSAGNLWLYGGFGYEASGTDADLWEYNTFSKLWTWIGSNPAFDSDAAPTYGTLSVASPGNSPGARTGGVTFADNGNHLWLFGGANGDPGDNPHSLASEVPYNDLWMFTP
jgi:hypothetical protein